MDGERAAGRFLVTSRGQTGSRWLGRALDRHPDIACSHGPFPLDVALDYDHEIDPDRRRALRDEVNRRIGSLGVDGALDELTAHAAEPFVGNVHMFSLRQLGADLQRRPLREPLQLANLVRHPVTWLHSAAANHRWLIENVESQARQRRRQYDANRELFDRFTRPHGVDPTQPDVLAFLGCCFVGIADMAWELSHATVHQVRMEQVTSDATTLATLVHHLTQGQVLADHRFLERVYDVGAINRHATGPRLSAEERFGSWAPWQREAFSLAVSRPGVRSRYEDVGYDLDFVAAVSV